MNSSPFVLIRGRASEVFHLGFEVNDRIMVFGNHIFPQLEDYIYRQSLEGTDCEYLNITFGTVEPTLKQHPFFKWLRELKYISLRVDVPYYCVSFDITTNHLKYVDMNRYSTIILEAEELVHITNNFRVKFRPSRSLIV